MSIITKELDRVSIVPKGVWNSQNTYERLDIVSYNGSSYIARKDVPENINLNNNEYWKLIAERGINGTNGIDGNGISSITEIDVTHSPGHTDIYRINFTNGDNFNFGIYNGTNGINGESGDAGEAGNGISSITEIDVTRSSGHTDRYQINFTNGDVFNFGIYNGINGADGTGSVSAVDGIEAISQNVELLIFGNGAPTENTIGQLKQRYYDLTNEKLYICTNVNINSTPTIYTWKSTSTNILIDSALSETSENPVQNKIVFSAINTLDNKIKPIDSTLSNVSENPVQNKVIKAAIDTLDNKIKPIDTELSEISENPVQNKVIKAAIDEKLDAPGSLLGILYRYKNAQTNQYETGIAGIGLNYGSYTFTLTLQANLWNNNALTVSNYLLTTSDKYSFIITPKGSSFKEYVDCGIYADDISESGKIVFHCDEVPTNNLVINVIRVVTETR